MHKLQVESVQPAHPKQRKCDILVNFMEISISNDEVNLEWIQIFNKQHLVLAKNANLRCLGEVLCVEVADKVNANIFFVFQVHAISTHASGVLEKIEYDCKTQHSN